DEAELARSLVEARDQTVREMEGGEFAARAGQIELEHRLTVSDAQTCKRDLFAQRLGPSRVGAQQRPLARNVGAVSVLAVAKHEARAVARIEPRFHAHELSARGV